MSDKIQSVERALTLLEEVSVKQDWVGVRDLAQAVNLKVPTAQKLLKTLAHKGYLEFGDHNRKYRLGSKIMLLAGCMDPGEQLKTICVTHIDTLFAEFGETVMAATLYHDDVLIVCGHQSRHPLAVAYNPGEVELHPHLTASGRILLAYQSNDFQRRYIEKNPPSPNTSNAPKTTGELIEILQLTRDRGWGEAFDVNSSGIGAYAFPAFDRKGNLALAIGCSVPLSRFTDSLRQKIFASLKITAERISLQLRG